MQMVITSTEQRVKVGGVECRRWLGKCDNGAMGHVFVFAMLPTTATDPAEWNRALRELELPKPVSFNEIPECEA